MELAEVQQNNLWRSYRNEGKMTLASVKFRSSKKKVGVVQPVGTTKSIQPVGIPRRMKTHKLEETPRTAKSDVL